MKKTLAALAIVGAALTMSAPAASAAPASADTGASTNCGICWWKF